MSGWSAALTGTLEIQEWKQALEGKLGELPCEVTALAGECESRGWGRQARAG